MALIELSDPNSLSRADSKTIAVLFKQHPEITFFVPDVPYTIKLGKEEHTVTLDHGVLRRERAHHPGFRYEILDPTPLGKGGEATIFKNVGTLALNERGDEVISIRKDKTAVIRKTMLAMEGTPEEKQEIERAQKVTELTPQELHAKSAVIVRNWDVTSALSVMNLFNGMDLDKALHEHLSIDQLLDIAKKSWQSLANYHATGNVHLDIKPENLMVNLTSNQVVIIDPGKAKKSGENDDPLEGPIGTPVYMSPEAAAHRRGEPVNATSTHSDVFSMGLTVAEMFGAEQRGKNDDRFTLTENIEGNRYPITNLFEGIGEGLSGEHKKLIYTKLEEIRTAPANNRPAAQEIADFFTGIQRERHPEVYQTVDDFQKAIQENTKKGKEVFVSLSNATSIQAQIQFLREYREISSDAQQILCDTIRKTEDKDIPELKRALGIHVVGNVASNDKEQIIKAVEGTTRQFNEQILQLQMQLSFLERLHASSAKNPYLQKEIQKIQQEILNVFKKERNPAHLDDTAILVKKMEALVDKRKQDPSIVNILVACSTKLIELSKDRSSLADLQKKLIHAIQDYAQNYYKDSLMKTPKNAEKLFSRLADLQDLLKLTSESTNEKNLSENISKRVNQLEKGATSSLKINMEKIMKDHFITERNTASYIKKI